MNPERLTIAFVKVLRENFARNGTLIADYKSAAK